MLPVVEIVVEIPMLVHDLVRLQSTVKPLNRGFWKKELMTPGMREAPAPHEHRQPLATAFNGNIGR
jgi:hypothetical protein